MHGRSTARCPPRQELALCQALLLTTPLCLQHSKAWAPHCLKSSPHTATATASSFATPPSFRWPPRPPYTRPVTTPREDPPRTDHRTPVARPLNACKSATLCRGGVPVPVGASHPPTHRAAPRCHITGAAMEVETTTLQPVAPLDVDGGEPKPAPSTSPPATAGYDSGWAATTNTSTLDLGHPPLLRDDGFWGHLCLAPTTCFLVPTPCWLAPPAGMSWPLRSWPAPCSTKAACPTSASTS